MTTEPEDDPIQWARFTTFSESPSNYLPPPTIEDIANANWAPISDSPAPATQSYFGSSQGNQQIHQASGTAFAPDNQYTKHTPNQLEHGGTHVGRAAADGRTSDTTTTEFSTGGPGVGHPVPGASSAGKRPRPANATDPPRAKRPKITDTSLAELHREIFRVRSDPTATQMEHCAELFTKMLGWSVTITEVSSWWKKYRPNQGPDPAGPDSSNRILWQIIRIQPEPGCKEMKIWADFIYSWTGTRFTPEHVFGQWYACWERQDPMAGECRLGSEDGTTASIGRDSGYDTGPPPQDATQPRGPELPIPTPSIVLPRLPVICPFTTCSKRLQFFSDWTKHKTSHWTTKWGCLLCYEKNGACRLCQTSLQPSDPRSVAEHVITCIQNNEDEVKRIIDGNKHGWWQDRKKLTSHLVTGTDHPDGASGYFSGEILETWKVERLMKSTTCKNCHRNCQSEEEIDEHYTDEHFGTQRKKNTGGGGDDHDIDKNNDDNDAGDGTSCQNRHSLQQNGKLGGSAHNTHQSGTAGTSYTAGQQRSAGMQGTRGGKDDVRMNAIIPSRKPRTSYGSLPLPNQHLTVDLNPNLHSGAYLWGMGSQFMDQSKGWPSAEEDETHEWLHEPHSTIRSPSKVVDLCQRLGRGSTATVGSVWYPKSDEELARKSVRLGQAFFDYSLLAQVRREIKTLTILRHRHITKLVDWYGTPQSMELLMSPVAEDNLMGFMSAAGPPGQPATERVVREPRMIEQVTRWMSCLSSALAYIHSKGVTHGDIKPHNILISGRQAWLGDFGTADFETAYATGPGTTSRWLTPVYSAPEVKNEGTRGRPSDIWSFGCLLLEVSTWMAGYQIQSLRNFRGSSRSQPYHVKFGLTLSWIRGLRSSFKLQDELRENVYILDALLAMLVLNPDARITGLEVWKRLAGRDCRDGGCPCDNEPPQVVDERLQGDLQHLPSGTLQTPEETETEVIDAMKECNGNATSEDDWMLVDKTSAAQWTDAVGPPWLHSVYSTVRAEWLEELHPNEIPLFDQHTTLVQESTSAEQVDEGTIICGRTPTPVSECAVTPWYADKHLTSVERADSIGLVSCKDSIALCRKPKPKPPHGKPWLISGDATCP